MEKEEEEKKEEGGEAFISPTKLKSLRKTLTI